MLCQDKELLCTEPCTHASLETSACSQACGPCLHGMTRSQGRAIARMGSVHLSSRAYVSMGRALAPPCSAGERGRLLTPWELLSLPVLGPRLHLRGLWHQGHLKGSGLSMV